jgi:hypothetical protein
MVPGCLAREHCDANAGGFSDDQLLVQRDSALAALNTDDFGEQDHGLSTRQRLPRSKSYSMSDLVI